LLGRLRSLGFRQSESDDGASGDLTRGDLARREGPARQWRSGRPALAAPRRQNQPDDEESRDEDPTLAATASDAPW
jgi:hypothetical protein